MGVRIWTLWKQERKTKSIFVQNHIIYCLQQSNDKKLNNIYPILEIDEKIVFETNRQEQYDSTMPSNKRFNKSGGRSREDSEMDEEYVKKREKNNAAVKRARQKAKEKSQQTFQRIQSIKNENKELEERIKALSKELSTMKNIYEKYTGEIYPGIHSVN